MGITDYLLEAKKPLKKELFNLAFERTLTSLYKQGIRLPKGSLSFKEPILTISLPAHSKFTIDKAFSSTFQKEYKSLFKKHILLTIKSVSYSKHTIEINYILL
jgi:hypothetical protein